MAKPKKAPIKARIECWITPTWRFQKRSGTTDKTEHNARKALLRRLIERGQLDVIRALEGKDAEGCPLPLRARVTWEQLRQAERNDTLGKDHLGADVALAKRLWDVDEAGVDTGAFALMLPKLGAPGNDGRQSRRRFGLVFQQLRELGPAAGLLSTATVKNLATMDWEAFFASMGHLSKSSRNSVRTTVSLFLTRYLHTKKRRGLHHPFRHEVMAVMGKKEKDTPRPKVLTANDWVTFYNNLDDAIKPIAWVLATSGMRIGEYLQLTHEHIRHLPDIQIPGYTQPGAVPNTPESIALARQAIPCPLPGKPDFKPGEYAGVSDDWRYEQIRRAFVKASEGAGLPRVTPHVLRHFFGQQAISKSGGAQSSLQVMHAMRHTATEMTSIYTQLDNVREVSNAVGTVAARGLAAPAPAPEVPAAPPIPSEYPAWLQ